MRLLVVADADERRDELALLARDAGHEVCGSSAPNEVSLAVLRDRPEGLLVDAPEDDASVLVRLLQRARATAQAQLPALLIFPPSSLWLRAPLSLELLPVGVVASTAIDLDGFEPFAARRSTAADGLRLDRPRRRVAGPTGTAELTPSEATLLGGALDADGAIISLERVAELLWGDTALDQRHRAAIRSHTHTLRRKLRNVGLDGVLETVSGVGFRVATPVER